MLKSFVMVEPGRAGHVTFCDKEIFIGGFAVLKSFAMGSRGRNCMM